MKQFIILAALLLAACGPANIQSSMLVDSVAGKNRYTLTGFTSLGETKPGSSAPYIKMAKGQLGSCQHGMKTLKVEELPAHNGAGQFLYWSALTECK